MATLPTPVEAAAERARTAGFSLSCDEDVGRLLAVLAAATPPGGRVLELGTGAGVGLAWIISGLGARTDVAVTSVEQSPATAHLASAGEWPPYVSLEVADALDTLERDARYSLIFADAQGGKWEGLDQTISVLAPGGTLVVDDMAPPRFESDEHRDKTAEVRAHLLADERLVAVELAWSSGVIMAVRRREAP